MSEIISHRLLARLATFVAISTLEPCVVLGQVEHELWAHGVAALRHAEHVEGGRVGERHVAQLGAGDAQALRGICRHREGEREGHIQCSLGPLLNLHTHHRSSSSSVSPNFSSRPRFHCPMGFPIIAAHYASPPLRPRHPIPYWSLPEKAAVVNLWLHKREKVMDRLPSSLTTSSPWLAASAPSSLRSLSVTNRRPSDCRPGSR